MKNFTISLISTILFLIAIPQLLAQVGIGTTSPQGALDITSSTSGVVVPRVALTSKDVAAPVVNPHSGVLAESTLVWNTATAGTGSNRVFPGFYFWKAGHWDALADGSGKDWSLSGNTGTNPIINYFGTKDNTNLVFKTNGITRMTIKNSVDPISGTAGDISIGDATLGTIKANKELVMRQDNDGAGLTVFRLRNRPGENGAIFENVAPRAIDFIFKTGPSTGSISSSTIRLESRSTASKKIATNITEFQIGRPDATNGGPTLVIGANGTSGDGSNSSFRIGNLGITNVNPQDKLHIGGPTSTIRIDGLNSANNSNNDGLRNVPVAVDAAGNLVLVPLTLTSPIFTDYKDILPATQYVQTIDNDGSRVRSQQYYVIPPSAEEKLILVSYQIGILVNKFGDPPTQLPTNHESKLFGAAIVVNNNPVITNGDFANSSYGCASGALSGDKYFNGRVFLSGQGIIKLEANTPYHIHLMGFVQNNAETTNGIKATYGANGNIDRFQLFELK